MKKHMKLRKIWSILLTFAMIIAMMPVTALADDEPAVEQGSPTVHVDYDDWGGSATVKVGDTALTRNSDVNVSSVSEKTITMQAPEARSEEKPIVEIRIFGDPDSCYYSDGDGAELNVQAVEGQSRTWSFTAPTITTSCEMRICWSPFDAFGYDDKNEVQIQTNVCSGSETGTISLGSVTVADSDTGTSYGCKYNILATNAFGDGGTSKLAVTFIPSQGYELDSVNVGNTCYRVNPTAERPGENIEAESNGFQKNEDGSYTYSLSNTYNSSDERYDSAYFEANFVSSNPSQEENENTVNFGNDKLQIRVKELARGNVYFKVNNGTVYDVSNDSAVFPTSFYASDVITVFAKANEGETIDRVEAYVDGSQKTTVHTTDSDYGEAYSYTIEDVSKGVEFYVEFRNGGENNSDLNANDFRVRFENYGENNVVKIAEESISSGTVRNFSDGNGGYNQISLTLNKPQTPEGETESIVVMVNGDTNVGTLDNNVWTYTPTDSTPLDIHIYWTDEEKAYEDFQCGTGYFIVETNASGSGTVTPVETIANDNHKNRGSSDKYRIATAVSNVKFTVTPDSGEELDEISINGNHISVSDAQAAGMLSNKDESGKYTFTLDNTQFGEGAFVWIEFRFIGNNNGEGGDGNGEPSQDPPASGIQFKVKGPERGTVSFKYGNGAYSSLSNLDESQSTDQASEAFQFEANTTVTFKVTPKNNGSTFQVHINSSDQNENVGDTINSNYTGGFMSELEAGGEVSFEAKAGHAYIINVGFGQEEAPWYTVSWSGGNVTVENGQVLAERVYVAAHDEEPAKTYTIHENEKDVSNNIYYIWDTIGKEKEHDDNPDSLSSYGLGFSQSDLFIKTGLEGVSIDYKFIPKYGYQLKNIYTNENQREESCLNKFTTDDQNVSRFKFNVRPNENVHFQVYFERTSDSVQTSGAQNVNGASISNGGNAVDSGNLSLTVTDTQTDSSVTDAVSTFDLKLDNLVSKGGDNGNWVTNITEFTNPITLTLNLDTSEYTANGYKVVRKHNGQYETINASYNSTNGKLTFNTNKFSSYSIIEDDEAGDPSHVHAYNKSVASAAYLKSAATCTSAAVYYKSCECGEQGSGTFTSGQAKGHSPVVDAAVAATCTGEGKTEGKHCSACGEVLTAQSTSPALGHDFSAGWTVDVEATSTSEGSKSQHCTRCNERSGVTSIPKTADTATEENKQEESTTSKTENPDGSTTTKTENVDGSTTTKTENLDGSTTTKTENVDGTTTTKTENVDGSTTTKTENKDGSSKEVTVAKDGTTTTVEVAKNGSKVETVEKVTTNKSGKEVEVKIVTKTNSSGKVTGSTETSVINNIAPNITATIVVNKSASGTTSNVSASVAASVENTSNVSIKADTISQIVEAAGGKNVKISLAIYGKQVKSYKSNKLSMLIDNLYVASEDESPLYTINVESKLLKAGNSLKLYKVKNGKYYIINNKNYIVKKDGSIAFNIASSQGDVYKLVDKTAAEKIVKKVRAAVKLAKTSVTVSKGKTTKVKFASSYATGSIKKIEYVSKNKNIATVNKSGKIKAKNNGLVNIQAKVTLKDGSKKTLTMKVKVK